jgi:hypothetical protein
MSLSTLVIANVMHMEINYALCVDAAARRHSGAVVFGNYNCFTGVCVCTRALKVDVDVSQKPSRRALSPFRCEIAHILSQKLALSSHRRRLDLLFVFCKIACADSGGSELAACATTL